MASKLSSKFGSLIIRIFILISWACLLLTLALAIVLTIYPNVLGNGTFGVWKTTASWQTSGSDSFSTLGWILLIVGSFSILFAFIIQAIAKSVKFTIGKSNKVISYFSSIMFPTIIFSVFAFVGTLNLPGFELPGHPNTTYPLHTLLFYNLNVNANIFPIAIQSTSTWVWLIFMIFAGISAITVTFTTIKLIIRLIFSGTHDKQYYTN